MFMLLALEQNCLFEENNSKQYFIFACDSGGDKIVFTLLEKVITLLVIFILVHIGIQAFNSLSCGTSEAVATEARKGLTFKTVQIMR